MSDWERERQARQLAYQQAAAPLIAALRDAGVDPTDFGRFVNRPVAGVLEPSHFDQVKALPVLIEWLPRIGNEDVKQSIVRHLKTRAARPVAAQPLLDEFHSAGDPYYKCAIGDTLAFICDKTHYDQIFELAADRSHSFGRAPLVDMLWRLKSNQAEELLTNSLDDPDVARFAMSALRRLIGNAQSRPLIEPLVHHPHEHIQQAAKDHLRRIDKSLSSTKNQQ